VISRRVAVAGLAALASLTLLTTACTTKPADTTAPAKSATEILNEAAAKTKDQSFTYTLSYGTLLTGDGAQSADGKSSKVNMNVSDAASGLNLKIGALVIGNDLYMKMDFGSLGAAIPGFGSIGDKWMHIDKAKVKPGSVLTVDPNSIGVEHYVKGVVSAEKSGDTEIKGTIDLAKSAPVGVDAGDIANLPAAERIAPFTATLDGDGRISKIVIMMPKVGQFPASALTTTFTGFGAAVEVAKPAAAQTVEAPDLIYQFL